MTIEEALKCIEYNRTSLAEARGSDYSGVEAIDVILDSCVLSKEEAAAVVALLNGIKALGTINMRDGMDCFVNVAHAYEKMCGMKGDNNGKT